MADSGPDGPTDGRGAPSGTAPVLAVLPCADPWRAWVADVAAHAPVLDVLARKDFQTRYKRASLGVLWVVALPLLQAVVLAFVFSRVARFDTSGSYTVFVMGGMFTWSYLSSTVQSATTAVVDGASLADKVWFPRVVLVLVPVVANVVGLLVSFAVLTITVPIVGDWTGWRMLLLAPAALLLVALTLGLSLVLSALHVYFRDTRFIVQAALLVTLYLTPVIYPAELLGRWEGWLDLNPATGVVELVHTATTGSDAPGRSLVVSLVAAVALLAGGAAVHRQRDRLFIDQL
ncbi:MAG: ABC transporter permease [Acidimicrobiales bacterium]|nr:ABC transporter permease [Acidimicrobiales bacterium]